MSLLKLDEPVPFTSHTPFLFCFLVFFVSYQIIMRKKMEKYNELHVNSVGILVFVPCGSSWH